MQDRTRVHERIAEKPLQGTTIWIEETLPGPVSVFVPDPVRAADSYDILMHFHGSDFVASTAVMRLGRPMVAVNVHLGSGSSVYEQPFLETDTFTFLLDVVTDSLTTLVPIDGPAPAIYLSAFSAGYGAVRAILRNSVDRIAGVLLLDGLHTDYVPERKVLADEGRLDEAKLESFVEFARMAMDGKKRMLITHSEIFPGTFASTTETADYIVENLGLVRDPVLEWGPVGMQLLSRVEAGRFTVLGFAGNTAPDHIDHLHGLPEFLSALVSY